MTALLTQDEKQLLRVILEELGHGDRDFFDGLSDHEQQFVSQMLRELRREGECPSLDLLWEVDYRERPVSIETFLDEPYYVGSKQGTREDWVYPAWRQALCEVFSPGRRVWEFILSGSIGTGKTTVAVLAMLYKLYCLSCLKDPQSFYEMAPGSPIVIGLYSVFKYQAAGTSFAELKAKVDVMPYFRERFQRNPRKSSTLEFPHSIFFVTGSSELHALGQNLYGCMIDEMDFMRKEAHTPGRISEQEKGQAWSLYTAAIRRIESRFMRLGDYPGLFCLISSKTERTGFIEQRIQDRADDRRCHIEDKPLWEVKPGRYSGKTFPVFVGDDYHDPAILTAEQVEKPGKMAGKIIDVPIEHRQPFEEDIEAALRDIAGVATVAETPFIPSRADIYACVNRERSHPFTKQEFSVTIDSKDSIEDFLDGDRLFRVIRSHYTPLVRPGANRYVHIDLAVTEDSVGLAMGHISGFRMVRRTKKDGFHYQARAPLIYIDLMLRVVPTPGSRIDLQKLRNFVFALKSYGFPIKHVSLDGWQSEDTVQQFLKEGVEASIVSMDRPPTLKEGAAYSYFRQAIMERRIDYYHYERFLIEAVHLQRTILPQTGGAVARYKVDHPSMMLDSKGRKLRGSKDVADAVGAVVRNCMVLDPAAQESAPVVKGQLPPQQPGGRPPPPDFTKDDRWVVGEDYDLDDVEGIEPW